MRLLIASVALVVAFSGTACRGKHRAAATVQNEEPGPAPRTASTFKMNDATAPSQMLHGFYGLESGTWRWTAGKFSVLLRPPLAAAQRGATMTFAFSVPDVVAQKVGPFTMTATTGTTTLKSEKYAKTGSYTFTADLAPELLTKDTVTIDFALDKFLAAGAVDHRELGVIAIAVGLESK